jgi:hypothetical protein
MAPKEDQDSFEGSLVAGNRALRFFRSEEAGLVEQS